MVELCLMASHGFHPSEYLPCRFPKQFLPNFAFNNDIAKVSFGQRMHQIEEHFKMKNGMLESKLFSVQSDTRKPFFLDFQDFPPNLRFHLETAAYVSRERAQRYFSSKSSDVERGPIDFTKLLDPQVAGINMPRQSLPLYYQQLLLDAESQPSLIAPVMESSSERTLFIGDLGHSYCSHLPGGQLLVASSCTEMNHIFGTHSDVYSSSNAIPWKKLAMVVPYFDRRISKAAKTSSHGSTPDAPMNSSTKLKHRTSPKKKSSTKASKVKNHHRINYLHECESLLSIMVDKKLHGRPLINFLKRSSPEIPKLLTQCSASIAGAGLAVVFSVVCKVVYDRVPFCGSKLLSIGLGIGLVWLSWAVNKLRDTVISINKNSGKLGVGDEEEMMTNLDRNVRDIYFRAVTLLAVAVLKFA